MLFFSVSWQGLNAECLCGEFYPPVQTHSLTSLATKTPKYIYVRSTQNNSHSKSNLTQRLILCCNCVIYKNNPVNSIGVGKRLEPNKKKPKAVTSVTSSDLETPSGA